MRRTLRFVFLIVAMLSSSIAFAQATPDGDADGIPDSRDRCPTAAGTLQNMGCPDVDNDGVVDIDDTCITVPGIPENSGCPQDSDGDGVGDFEDVCPFEAGPTENRGCSLPPAGDATPVPSTTNPLVPPTDGPCQAATFLTSRVNGRNAPAATAAIIAVLESNILYPVLGLVAVPDEEEAYLVIELEDALITSIAAAASDTQPAFDPAFMGGVFVAASTMRIDGDCGPTPVGLLLPAIQKIREAARAHIKKATLFMRKSGGDSAYYQYKLSDLIVTSLTDPEDDGSTEASGGGGGAGKAHFSDMSFLAARIVEGEDGDTLVFDLTNEPQSAGADYLLELGGVEGESSEANESEGTGPIVTESLLYLFSLLNKLETPSGEGDGSPATCEEQFFDEMAAMGATVEVLPTDYGFEFVLVLPPGSEPNPVPCADHDHKGEIEILSFSWGLFALDWQTAEDGSVRASLTKVGPGVLMLNNSGFAHDGSVCFDLQPIGAVPLCVPSIPAEF